MEIKKLLATTLAGILVVSITTCSRGPALTRYDTQFLQSFDTVISIVGYAKDKETSTVCAQELHDELEVYHQLYDTHYEYEDINNLKTVNGNAGVEPVAVGRKIIDMLEFAKELNARTNGYFNMTMGGVLSIWHEYRTTGIDDLITAELSPIEAPEKAGRHMGISDAIIDKKTPAIYLTDADMSLDVGAIARGYATEMVCRELKEDGLTKTLASVGGNVQAIDTKDGGSKQKLGIQNPDLASDTKFLHMIVVADMSLVTNGNYQRYYTVGGVQYHHIVNPDTLMPWFEYDPILILCKDSRMADALSAAVFNMEQENGQALIESLDGVEAMWLYPDGSKKYSSDFQAYMGDE